MRLPLLHRQTLRARLDALLVERDPSHLKANDPVGLVHAYRDAADIEVAGFVAAMLAFGNVTVIRRSVARVLAALGDRPSHTVDSEARDQLALRLRGFRHRVYSGEDLAVVLANVGALRREQGALGRAFETQLARAAGALRPALVSFADRVRGAGPTRSLRHLVADPRGASACKRWHLYLRWMCRPSDGVDFGIWRVPPSVLLVPVDTHIGRIAYNLRLTHRRDASWKTAESITATLRAFAPEDPTRYDFALCHFGVSRDCPSRRDAAKCARCVLRPSCRQWRAIDRRDQTQ